MILFPKNDWYEIYQKSGITVQYDYDDDIAHLYILFYSPLRKKYKIENSNGNIDTTTDAYQACLAEKIKINKKLLNIND